MCAVTYKQRKLLILWFYSKETIKTQNKNKNKYLNAKNSMVLTDDLLPSYILSLLCINKLKVREFKERI